MTTPISKAEQGKKKICKHELVCGGRDLDDPPYCADCGKDAYDIEAEQGKLLKPSNSTELESFVDKSTPIPENTSDWEKDLVLYLTSAGDRRRAIHFIKELIATQVAAAEARQKDRIKEWAKQYQSNQQTKDYFKDSSFKGDFVLNLVNETMDDLIKLLDSNPQ